MSAERCQRCNDRVYEAEKRIGAGKSWHKRCFTCETCRKGLDSTTLSEKEGKIYCKSCYGKHFATKGYGYGAGAGTLSMDTGDPRKQPDMRVFMGQAPTSSVGIGPRCLRCGHAVYDAEKMTAAGQGWHRGCFNCKDCNKKLDSTTLAEHELEIYCKGCYGKNFGPKGCGFGLGAGALTHTT